MTESSEGPTAADDEAVLRMLGGATFGPDSSLILPTGRRLDGAEAQAFTSLYAPTETQHRACRERAFEALERDRSAHPRSSPAEDIVAEYRQHVAREIDERRQRHAERKVELEAEQRKIDRLWNLLIGVMIAALACYLLAVLGYVIEALSDH